MIDILMFHRVLPKTKIKDNDVYFYRGTLISQERLEEVILQYLNLGYTFNTVSGLDRESNVKQVVLSFDDGYLDNYLYAKPILEKYNINATFYPVIGYCKEQKNAPLDYYYHYILENIDSKDRASWVVGKKKKAFLNLSMSKQENYIKDLFTKVPINTEVSYLTLDQIQELHELGHEIGGHSYSHEIYTLLSPLEILEDIQTTRQTFSQIGINISSFAYTDGQYNLTTIESLKKENIKYACAIKSVNISTDKDFEIERVFVTENRIFRNE